MEGSNLSPRVFTELFELFKRQKVEISHAIKTTFPFLEGLRDNNLISSKMYEDFQGSCRALVPVQEVIYKALDELEKKFDMKVLHELFSEVNMEKYPNLKLIHRSFKNVLQNELFFYRSDGGGPNSQLSLGKGPSGSSSQRSLTWLSLDPSSSEGRRNNDRRNSCLIRGNQTETHQLSESPNHLVSSLPEDGLSEDLCENVLIRRVRRDAATNTDKNTNEPERKPASMPRGPGSVPDGAEGLSHGFQINPCSVPLVDIKKEKSSFSLHGNQQTGARINQNEDSEVIELSSDDSDGGDNFPEASTLVPSQPEPTSSRKPPTPRTYRRDTVDVGKNPILGKDGGKRRGKRARLGNYLKRNIKIPMKASWKTDFLARSVNPSWGRKRGWTIPRYDLANFRGTELPVKCGNVEGTLHKEKFKQGIYMKSIKSQTGQWLTPMEFEIEGKREKSKNWRQSIRCKKVTLRELIKIGVLQDPPRKKKETPPNPWQTKRKLGKPKACKVCRKPRKVYPCATCREFYHKNCHIPPVEDKSGPWHCAFCKRKNQLRCQNTQECHKEAEVLKRKMSPEEQLKCELLLLTIYCYPKSGYFIQKPKQRKRDFPDLQEHMWLNKIKNWLNKKTYRSVQCFVEDMRLIFQNHSIFYKGKFKNLGIRVGNKFEKTFKRIFSIEDASNEHPPCKHSSVTLVRSDPSTTNPSSS